MRDWEGAEEEGWMDGWMKVSSCLRGIDWIVDASGVNRCQQGLCKFSLGDVMATVHVVLDIVNAIFDQPQES